MFLPQEIHAASHCLPYRGPGATRARTRWQPYSSVTLPPTSTCSRTSPVAYLHTPASSVTSSPLSINTHLSCDIDQLKPAPLPQTPRTSRDLQRNRYASLLVDQAVRSLCDSWPSDAHPLTCHAPAYIGSFTDLGPTLRESPLSMQIPKQPPMRNTQLPSPVSPSSHMSPSPNPPHQQTDVTCQVPESVRLSNLVPIKGFVHEVLRRSRTSTGVLQTALCYLEAVRLKLPEILRKEQEKALSHEEAQSIPRIVQGQDAEVSDPRLFFLDVPHFTEEPESIHVLHSATQPAEPTRQRHHAIQQATQSASAFVLQPDISSSSAPEQPVSVGPGPILPSPLLCPRRTFLACLILASKFMQDRSYSNRAWAKLAGLSPREIGRCERALGDALDWRLWVGKDPNVGRATKTDRTLARSHSDSDVLRPPGAFLTASSMPTTGPEGQNYVKPHLAPAPTPAQTPKPAMHRDLRRSATLPVILVEPPAPNYSILLDNETYAYGNIGALGTAEVQSEGVSSPSLSTPSLSYSPMSTSSSSSDGMDERTVQMPTSMALPPSSSPSTLVRSFLPSNRLSKIEYGPNSYAFSVDAITVQEPEVFMPVGPTLPAFNPPSMGVAHYNLPSLDSLFSRV